MLALSTCWNARKHRDGEALLWEIGELGFGASEISHGTSASLLPGIFRRVDRRRIRITSVHNFCPSPVEIGVDDPDVYQFTSPRPGERQRALDLTLRSLETAARCGAETLVIHLGSVRMRSGSARLESMARAGKLFSRTFCRAKLKMVRRRERLGARRMDQVRELLSKIADRAAEVGVSIGIESRSHYEQMPDERELMTLMEDFADHPRIGYWHDFGHVQRKANVGLLDHAEWIERMRPHWLGAHLHDVEWPATDHRIPFSGGPHGIDFDRLMALVPRDKPLVWELSPRRNKREDIMAAREAWLKRFPSPDPAPFPNTHE